MGKASTATRVHGPDHQGATAGQRPWKMDRVTYSISAAGCTDRGHRRTENQDCILCETSGDAVTGIFAVADGMGGQSSGEIASAIAIATLREHLLPLVQGGSIPTDGKERTAEDEQVPLNERVSAAIAHCNERILTHAAAHPETKGLGSTLTLALIRGSLAIIGNIGDSRTYRVRNGAIERLTNDHSLVAHLAAIGQIAPDEVYTHPHRSYIYRALGAEAAVQPDIIMERLQSGDTLLLCSDGLWEMVRDEGIHDAVAGSENADQAASRLVDLANGNGGEDNISVIVVKVQGS